MYISKTPTLMLSEHAIESHNVCDVFVAVFTCLQGMPCGAVSSVEGGPVLLERVLYSFILNQYFSQLMFTAHHAKQRPPHLIAPSCQVLQVTKIAVGPDLRTHAYGALFP